MATQTIALGEILDRLTVEGTLYQKLENNAVRCYACGHRCLIKDGREGICHVRFNRGGTLYVPHGYVGALQVDPTEKKPFFHILPGSNTLTFGMLGCDLHCSYCFTGDTPVVTDRGPMALADAFSLARRIDKTQDAESAYPENLHAVAASGSLRRVRAVFRHAYRGQLAVIRPYTLPELRCTPDHRLYATDSVNQTPKPIEARQLTDKHYLAIPRNFAFSAPHVVNAADELRGHQITYRVPWDLSPDERQEITEATARGETSRPIGTAPGRSASTIRRVRVQRATTAAVAASKASAALLFKSLAGDRAVGQRVPRSLFDAPCAIVEAFLDGYVKGDGHHYANGKISVTTVSRSLAYDIAWLALKLGHLPSVYDTPMPESGVVQGRSVKRSPHPYAVVWYENASISGKVVETDEFYLVPLRTITYIDYDGDVYNMEVEEEHNYLAGFFLVSNCQNWLTSQALRDPDAGVAPQRVTPQELVKIGKHSGASLFGSSYNEPLITTEWAVDVFKAANAAGFRCVYISNGNATPEALDYLAPHIVGYKVDLKSMNDRNYRRLGAELNKILDGIKMVHERGLWLEIVTLTIPGFNDSNEEVWDAARFIASISPDIPWHVTAFHKDYKMTDPDNTDVKTLLRAAEIGQEAGLRYVYAGNLPGQVGTYENTYCPNCRELLVERRGYTLLKNVLSGSGRCPKCSTPIAGIWS